MSNPFLIIGSFVLALFGITILPKTAEAPVVTTTTISAAEYIIEPTTTTSSTLFIDPYGSACEQFSALAVNLGWPVDQRTVLESIMFRESRCIPDVINGNDPNGGSRGLLQINGFWNKWLIERDLIDKPSDLLHADANLRAGLEIYNYGVNRYGFGWGPWSATK
jgi:hypothetical protein